MGRELSQKEIKMAKKYLKFFYHFYQSGMHNKNNFGISFYSILDDKINKTTDRKC